MTSSTSIRFFFHLLFILLSLSISSSSSSSSSEAIISRFQEYLQIDTSHPSPNYHQAATFILSIAKTLSLEHQTFEYIKNKPLIVLKWPGSNPSLPSILLNSHTDVVPVEPHKWAHPPFQASIDDHSNIYARGSQDMKCVGLQYLEAIKKLQDENFVPLRNVYLSFVPDEEIGGHDGAEKFANSKEFEEMNVGIVLDEGLANPDDFYRLFYAERCPMWLVIKASGAPGHGAKLYDNTAMENLLKSIESVRRFRGAQFDLVKAGLRNEGEVVSVNMVFLKAGTPSPTRQEGQVSCLRNGGTAGLEVHLTDLCLIRCGFHLPPTFNGFGSLTSLYLQEVNFSTGTLQHLLSNCPLLKTLDIHDPWISGSIGGPTISEIFECLPVIETFSIPLELIRVFRNIAIHKVPRELSTTLIHLKYLHIDGVYFFSKTELSVLALLIGKPQSAEKTKARVWDNSNFEISKIKYCFRVEDYSDIMLERLIELEITSFINAKNQLDFVRLILARSPVMKKVRIFPHYKIPKKEKLKIKSQILGDSISYPYASPDVQIIVAG
ncbi:aminoacylase-1 isoform X2 [Tanacetum coccineum]